MSTPGGISPLPALAWADGQLAAAGLQLRPRETPAEVRAAPWSAGPALATLLAAPPLQVLADGAALDLFAFEREQALVLGAGLPMAWKTAGDIAVAGLSTAWGRLDYRLQRRAGAAGWTLTLDRRPERLRGELRLAWPGTGPLPQATANGRMLSWQGRELPLPPDILTVALEPPP